MNLKNISRMAVDPHLLYKHVGAAVKAARTKKKMPQETLAASVGLTRTSICNLEGGNQMTPLHVLYNIAIVCGIEVTDLLP